MRIKNSRLTLFRLIFLLLALITTVEARADARHASTATAAIVYRTGSQAYQAGFPLGVPNRNDTCDTSGLGEWIWPTCSDVPPAHSSPFGPRQMASEGYRYDWHRGADIPLDFGSPIYATADGTVRLAGTYPYYSDTLVQLRHGDSSPYLYTNYMHLSAVAVAEDDPVTAGDLIGYSGASASGFAHLHLEFRDGCIYQDCNRNPWEYLPYTDQPPPLPALLGANLPAAPSSGALLLLEASTPADQLDLDGLDLTWGADDVQVSFNAINATTPRDWPQALDHPLVPLSGTVQVCLLPDQFNSSSTAAGYRLAFQGLDASATAGSAALRDLNGPGSALALAPVLAPLILSPGTRHTDALPGDTLVFTHTLENTGPQPLDLTLQAQSAQNSPLILSHSDLTLGPGETQVISLTLTLSDTLSPGTGDCVVVEVDGGLAAHTTIAVDSATVQGTTYYVALDGDDDDPGTVEAPWRTVQHAVDSVDPGDTIIVRAGTYAGARIERSGIAAAPITLQAAPGETVLLDAPGSANQHDSILEVETWEGTEIVAYWVIEGFEVANAPRYGIDIRNAHHITVRDNHVHDSSSTGIFTAFTDDVLIEDNQSHHNGEHGVYHSNSGDRPTIRGNRLHDNYGCGIHVNADASMGGDGIVSDGLVEDNVIYENGAGGGSGINMDGVNDTIVRNNLLYDNHASGISLYQIDGAVCSSDNRVLNNTVVMADDGRWALNIPDAGCTGNQVYNNIFYNHHSWRGSIAIASPSPSGFASDYNVIMERFSTDGGDTSIGLTDWQALGYDTHSLVATPGQLFADPAADDYHLKASSPAIDAGTNANAPETDLDGNPRPLDGDADEIPVADVGADEFTLLGDFDHDCDVEMVDIAMMLNSWHTSQGDEAYNVLYDLDDDGDVDAVDVMFGATAWGETCG